MRFVVVSAIVLASCTAVPRPKCQAGMRPVIAETLFFGTSTPTGTVSEEAWQQFLAEVVTPEFPAGLTAWEASGQWRSNGVASITRERTHVLQLIHPSEPSLEQPIARIIREYQRRFEQEAVLRTRAEVCASY